VSIKKNVFSLTNSTQYLEQLLQYLHHFCRHNIDRTVMLNGLIAESLKSWIEAGVLRPETLYGFGILNEPHICGTWRDGGKWWPVCRDDYYPLGRDYSTALTQDKKVGTSIITKIGIICTIPRFSTSKLAHEGIFLSQGKNFRPY
jgi:hypothetical protein